MYKKLITISLTALGFISFASCGNDPESPLPINQQENEIASTPFEKILTKVVTEHKEGDNSPSYIIYDASSQEYLTMTADEYYVCDAFATLVVRDNDSNIKKVPPGQGWMLAGKGKNKMDALKIARALSGKIPEKQDFEVRVEYNPDGSYSVWYRYV